MNISEIYQEQKSNKPTYEQLATLLDGQMKDNMHSLINFLKQQRLTPRWYATNSFHIKYKGKIIFRFNIRKNAVDLFFTVAEKSDLDSVLNSLPKDMVDFYFSNLRLCSGCNPKHRNGKNHSILNKNYWICAEPEMRIKNPTEEHIEYLKRFINCRRENILSYLKQ